MCMKCIHIDTSCIMVANGNNQFNYKFSALQHNISLRSWDMFNFHMSSKYKIWIVWNVKITKKNVPCLTYRIYLKN